VPLADFINHPPDGVVEANVQPFYDVKSGEFIIRTTCDVKKNQGIYWDYGFKSNRSSLLRYGFTNVQRIPQTDMPLFFKLGEFGGTDADKKIKTDIMEAAKKSGTLAMDPDGSVMHEFSLTMCGPHAERLLGHMRFMALKPDSSMNLDQICGDTYCKPISVMNERLALLQLQRILKNLISSYATTVDEDKVLVEQKMAPRDGVKWDTLLIRYGEKRILHGFVRMLGAIDALFKLSPDALATEVAKSWSKKESDIHRYVQETVTSLVIAEDKAKTAGGE